MLTSNEPKPPSGLFRTEGTERIAGHPALLGGRCQRCGLVFFPMQSYGCEACGSTELSPHAIGGRGALVASARVHLHAKPDRPVPFTVGSVVTEEGAAVRALLDPEAATRLKCGDRVVTILVPEISDGLGASDLRFTGG